MKSLNFSPGNFTNPADISRQVDNLAQNIDQVFRRLPVFFMPSLRPVRPIKLKVSAALSDLLFVDALSAPRTVVFPVAPQGVVSTIGIIATNLSSNDVTVVSGGKGVAVNNVTSFVLPVSNRLYLFMTDGASGWWSTG